MMALRMPTVISIWYCLNKIIKDIIIREKNMSGYCAPYVPGYDTTVCPLS